MKKKLTYEELLEEKERLEIELRTYKAKYEPRDHILSHKLTDLIKIDQLRDLMNYFYQLTGYAIAVGDNENNILVGLGWQEICTKYHRAHPETCRNCQISDDYFHQQKISKPIAYKCKNGLWDIACPIIINGKNIAAVFFGQFFYEDEPLNLSFFEKQAEKYGFEKDDYLEKVKKVPRIPRRKVNELIGFYSSLAQMVADIGYQNLLLKQTHQKTKTEFKSIFDNLVTGIAFTSPSGQILNVNKAYEEITGYKSDELLQKRYQDITHPDDIDFEQQILSKAIESRKKEVSYEKRYLKQDGKEVWVHLSVSILYDKHLPTHLVGVANEITEQKRIEKELTISEERYKNLVENSPDIIYVYSKNKGALYWSPRVNSILGFTPEDLINNPFKWNHSIHPDDRDKVNEAIQNPSLNATIDLEYRVKSKNGNWVWLHDRITSKKKIDGDILLEGYATDITQRVKAENELIKSQNKLHTFLESSPIGIAISKRDNSIQMLNRKFVELFGYTLDDIPTINDWFPLAYPDNEYRHDIIERWDNETKLCTTTNQPFRPIEGTVHCKDGTQKIIEFGFKQIGEDQITTFVDVTERKGIEQRIRESEIQFKKLYNNTPIMMHAINMQGQLISVNQYWLKKLGYNKDEVLGKKSIDFLTKESREKAIATLPHLFEKNEVKDIEFKFVKKGGVIIDVLLSAQVQYNESNQPISAFAMLRDVTEQKQAREQIIAQNKQLKELNITKDKFFSIIAHDLKAPFNIILGFSELIMDRIKQKRFNEVERFAKLISHATNHSNDLLSNLLEWSRTQTGQIKLKLDIYDVNETIDKILAFLKPSITSKNLSVRCQLLPHLKVLADKHMLETILRNLLSNAIKFTPHNGLITIQTSSDNKWASISIKDTGIGIDAEDLPKLFKIESNFTTRGTNKETGTGLGLILCKEFIEAQGGQIFVCSTPDKGSTFTFTLPL